MHDLILIVHTLYCVSLKVIKTTKTSQNQKETQRSYSWSIHDEVGTSYMAAWHALENLHDKLCLHILKNSLYAKLKWALQG